MIVEVRRLECAAFWHCRKGILAHSYSLLEDHKSDLDRLGKV